MKYLAIAILFVLVSLSPAHASENGKHLFILSGQSNMGRLDPNVSFTPTVEAAFGKANVIVVKDAWGGQPIRRWYKQWSGEAKPRPDGKKSKPNGYLYDHLMTKVNKAIEDTEIKSVTFVWMQGERDAREQHDSIYKESLSGLFKQLSDDMERKDINFVIGRLSQALKSKSWEGIRKAQVQVAETHPRSAWIDTDDVDIDGIHYTEAGYKDLGKRFADKAIELVNAIERVNKE